MAYLHWATCHNKDHPSIKIERLKLFQNNNNNLNSRILKHMAALHLPLIMTKIVTS
jgi:hypothetical protein